MSYQSTEFDRFTEKIILHNKLATEEQLRQATQNLNGADRLSLLDYLVENGTIKQAHAELIKKKIKQMQQELISKKAPSTAESASPNPAEKPVNQSTEKAASIVQAGSDSVSEILELIKLAGQMGASDLHLSPSMQPVIRMDGKLQALNNQEIDAVDIESVMFNLLSESDQILCRECGSSDGAQIIDGRRIRYSIVKSLQGWEASIRFIAEKPPRFEDMNFPEAIRELACYREGLVLVAGPAGSGKSTTLAAIVDYINRTRNEHILMLEDPIETVFSMYDSHISQRAVGAHTKSFSKALRAALREDPDIIVIGELRDRETTALAVSAAETGHLVFATLHTTSAPQTLHRLLDFFPPDQRNQVRAMLSESLRGILCQRLVPRADKQGRVLAMEIMLNITAIANIIREDKLYQLSNIIQINSHQGMQLLDEILQEMVSEGIVDGREAYFAANLRQNFANFAPMSLAEKEDDEDGGN
ncbi:PilT/PilU family type 4a pilus ATPase [bacterium]|nr:PilT/PilU family type 4a pilus ATPase [bacterium]